MTFDVCRISRVIGDYCAAQAAEAAAAVADMPYFRRLFGEELYSSIFIDQEDECSSIKNDGEN